MTPDDDPAGTDPDATGDLVDDETATPVPRIRPVPPAYVALRRTAAALIVITALLATWLALGVGVVPFLTGLVPGWFDLLWPF